MRSATAEKSTEKSTPKRSRRGAAPRADRAGSIDIVEAILRDHEDLKRFIETMKDEDAAFDEKEEAYRAFSALLKSHAPSEEKALYEPCLKKKDLGLKTNESFVEHEVATLLMGAIDKAKDGDRKAAEIKVLAEAVEHHIEEEEGEFLPEIAKAFGKAKREEMGMEFLRLRKRSQKEVSSDNAGILERSVH